MRYRSIGFPRSQPWESPHSALEQNDKNGLEVCGLFDFEPTVFSSKKNIVIVISLQLGLGYRLHVQDRCISIPLWEMKDTQTA